MVLSLVAIIGIGVGALITGVTSGYFIFNNKHDDTNIEDTKGIINNVVQVDKDTEKLCNFSFIIYLLFFIIFLLISNLSYSIYHCHRRKIKKKYIQRNVQNVATAL